jgi:Zn-dependent metalloprotease
MNSILRAGGCIGALLLAGLLVGFASPAGAFVPASQNQNYEILLPQFDTDGYQSADGKVGGDATVSTLAARYGGNWRVQTWNSRTGTPHWVYGTSAKVTDGIRDAADAERLARQVITENEDVLRANPRDLRLTATPNAAGKWAVHFQQTWNGLDVWGATVRVLFSESGRLMLMGSDFYPTINLSPVAAVSEAQAIGLARAGLPFNPATDRIEDGATLLVLPVPLSASEVEQHLVWRVRVRTEDPLGVWVTHVDAHTGKILWRYNDIDFAYSGPTSTVVQYLNYCDGSVPMTLPYLRINVSGVGTAISDVHGNWSIAGTGGARTVTSDLYGPYVDVNNIQGSQAAFTGTAQEDTPFTVSFLDANARKDERDVFDAVNDVHDFFETFAPGFAYTNTRITANVNRSSTCNAYWDGTINFYMAGGGCANTGEMQQVVHHEFTHGVQNAILGQQGDQGLGEGNADICGNLMTQDPIIGRGFYTGNCTSGIRNSLNTLRYPGDVIGVEIHAAGQVIAGFNWDSMVLLQAQYGESIGTWMSAQRWHNGRVLMHPTTQPDQVLATFIADDDNGNLDDGTPNHAIFCQAATNHGFTCPAILVGVYITHDGHPYSGDRIVGYNIRGTIISLPVGVGSIVPGSVLAHYRVDGGSFNDVPMTATGNPDEYGATIPAQPYGSIVEYYMTADDNLGHSGSSPQTAPTELHYFQVNDTFADAMETVTAWKVGATDDNASTGVWTRVDPIGTTSTSGFQAQPEDDHTAAPGTMCFVTGQGTVGGGPGEADVDGGKTTLFSPRFDLNDATDVAVSYWKWYSNNRGNDPGTDYWRVGVSNDGGTTWTAIENTTASTTEAWVEVAFDLATYIATPNIVQFRFVAEDVSPGSLVEAGVDDFLLTAVFDITGAEDGFGVRFVTGLDQNAPNPFGSTTDIRFRLAQPGSVALSIYDATGRRVVTLADGVREPGEHHVSWNGTDASGRAVAAGTYFCRLVAGGKDYSARLVMIR